MFTFKNTEHAFIHILPLSSLIKIWNDLLMGLNNNNKPTQIVDNIFSSAVVIIRNLNELAVLLIVVNLWIEILNAAKLLDCPETYWFTKHRAAFGKPVHHPRNTLIFYF